MGAPALSAVPGAVVTAWGAERLADEAEARTIVITEQDRPVAVVLSPQRFEDLVRETEHVRDLVTHRMAALLTTAGPRDCR